MVQLLHEPGEYRILVDEHRLYRGPSIRAERSGVRSLQRAKPAGNRAAEAGDACLETVPGSNGRENYGRAENRCRQGTDQQYSGSRSAEGSEGDGAA
ncbi:hypothetical protein D3C81_1517660 [compost metagenome]